MHVKQLIKRFKTLEPESERKCLEYFLFGLTGINRQLWLKEQDSEIRLRTLFLTNEINHYVLKRVNAIANRDKNTFFTVERTWHTVKENAASVPALEQWVADLADYFLEEFGA